MSEEAKLALELACGKATAEGIGARASDIVGDATVFLAFLLCPEAFAKKPSQEA